MKTAAKKPKLNVRLLRRIKDHILEEPRRFFMDWFVLKANAPEEWERDRWGDASKTMPPCGTAACIAGWANILTDPSARADNLERAEDLIGIPVGKYFFEWHPLFEVKGWPEPFRSRYSKATTPKARAKIAAERIEHFIKTKGAE